MTDDKKKAAAKQMQSRLIKLAIIAVVIWVLAIPLGSMLGDGFTDVIQGATVLIAMIAAAVIAVKGMKSAAP